METDNSRRHDSRAMVKLCTQTFHPIDTGNYPGPVHCTAHPEGHACPLEMFQMGVYPRSEGDVIVIGPEVVAAPDRSSILWQGALYVCDPARPLGPQGAVAKVEFWLRDRGWKRLANALGRWDERGLR